jgi:hypothetical protein
MVCTVSQKGRVYQEENERVVPEKKSEIMVKLNAEGQRREKK